ncbi:MAG: GGDEF domain-containing protein [Microthrixaceae bacterium]
MLSTSRPDPDSSAGGTPDGAPLTNSAEATADEAFRAGLEGTDREGTSVIRRQRNPNHGARSLRSRHGASVIEPRLPAAVPTTIASVALPIVVALVAVLLGLPGAVTIALVAAGSIVAGAITMFWIVRPLTEMTVSAVIDRSDVEQALTDERSAQHFRDRLDRALRSSQSEPATIGICLRAVKEILPESDISLLLNLPNEPIIGWRVSLVEGRLKPAVPVSNGPTCVGLGTLSTAVSSSSTTLDACGHLSNEGHDVSSVCIPLSLGERTLGAVSATSAPGEVPPLDVIERVEWVIERSAVRVAEQRLQRGPSVAGRPDPVTGLPGPSALRHQLRDLVRTLSPFCVAIISIDSFDEIRYRSGEDAADQTLGLVADALCSTVRPDDLVCRIDGPRFAVVFADCTARQAIAAMERFRESLALMLAAESQTPFTCSAGLVESHRATSIESLIELSVEACAEAEAAGGNRVNQSFER